MDRNVRTIFFEIRVKEVFIESKYLPEKDKSSVALNTFKGDIA